jgi:type II secretory pathway component PulK
VLFPIRNPKSEIRNRGFVLIAVLVVVALLAMMAVTQMLITRSEMATASATLSGQQAKAAAYSGIVRAMALLQQSAADPATWYDNPQVFQDQCIAGSGADGWYFSVYSPNLGDSRQVRFGLEDENGKFNVNTFFSLPGAGATATRPPANPPTITLDTFLPDHPDLRDCLLEFIDPQKRPQPLGVGQEYYDSLSVPYRMKNGPLSSIDELLLVKGFTGQMVYGNDANRNGTLEPNENDGDASFPPDNADGSLDLGLAAYLTAVTYGPNVSSRGTRRVNINDPKQINAVATDFPETAKFLDAEQKSNSWKPYNDPAALLGKTLDMHDPADTNPANKDKKVPFNSGIRTKDDLAKALDLLTCGGDASIGGQEVLIGRVNVNTAPAKVLEAILGDAQAAQRAVDTRGGLSASERETPAWLLDVLSSDPAQAADAFRKAGPYITARSFQFRLRSMGYNPASGRYCVLEAVIDTTGRTPRVAYLRDLTGLGVPLLQPGREKS